MPKLRPGKGKPIDLSRPHEAPDPTINLTDTSDDTPPNPLDDIPPNSHDDVPQDPTVRLSDTDDDSPNRDDADAAPDPNRPRPDSDGGGRPNQHLHDVDDPGDGSHQWDASHDPIFFEQSEPLVDNMDAYTPPPRRPGLPPSFVVWAGGAIGLLTPTLSAAGAWQYNQSITGGGGTPSIGFTPGSGGPTTATTTTTTTTTTSSSTTPSTLNPATDINNNNNDPFGDLPTHLEIDPDQDWTPIEQLQAKQEVKRLLEEYQGNLVYKFSQGKEMNRLPMKIFQGTPRGICATLVLDWLNRHYNNLRDYNDPHYNWLPNRIESIRKLAKLHISMGKVAEMKRILGALKENPRARESFKDLAASDAFHLYGYQSSQQRFAQVLREALEDPAHPGLAITLSGSTPVGHAIGVLRVGDQYRVFDPNFGVYQFPTAEAATRFIVRLWKTLYLDHLGLKALEGTFIDPPRRGG